MTQLSQRMVELGTAKSEIREAFAFAQARAAEIGPENVDDFSIGNPSVPAPDTVAQMVHQLVDTVDPILLHGYTPAQGDAAVRQALADDLINTVGVVEHGLFLHMVDQVIVGDPNGPRVLTNSNK